ncbi:MAG: hypothetical protein U1A77_05255 [Pirellulales bacterium]
MTAAAFNPYHEWLGLDPSQERPNYFQLLGLDDTEDRLDVITSAADRALSRVRGHRPGVHAAQWAAVLDQISAAKKCLTDEAYRIRYRKELEATKQGAAERSAEGGQAAWGGASGGNSSNAPFSSVPLAPASPAPNPAPLASTGSPMGQSVAATGATGPISAAPGTAWGGTSAGAAWPTGSAWPSSGLPLSAATSPFTSTPGTANPSVMNTAGASALPASSAATPAAGPAWGAAWGAPPGAPNPMAPMTPSYGPTNPMGSTSPNTQAPNYGVPGMPATGGAAFGGMPTGMPSPGTGWPNYSGSPSALGAPASPSPMAPAPQAYGAAMGQAPLAASPYGAPYPGAAYPGAPYPSPNTGAPMGAPVAGGYAYPAPQAAPMAAPLAMPVPLAQGSPLLAAPTAYSSLGGGVLGGTDSHMAPGQLLVPDEAVPGSVEPPRVRTTHASRAVLAQQQARNTQTPLILAIGTAIVLVLGGVLFVVMNDENEQIAAATPNVPVAPTKNVPMLPTTNLPERDADSPGKRRGERGGPKSGTRPPKTTVAIGKADSLADGDPAMTSAPPSKDPKKDANSMENKSENGSDVTPKTDAKPEMKPEMPADPPSDSKPESKPEPATKPEPDPKPEPKPEPKPVPRPSKDELSTLARALETARIAISEQQYEVAKQEIEKAEAIAKVPAHVARVERLKVLNHFCQEFRAALRDAVKNLKAGEAITVKTTTVGIVETFSGQDKIILRVAGMNRTYRFEELPIGLAVAIADMWLDKTQASSLVIKAAYVGAHKSATAEMKGKAREWLDEAQAKLPEVVSQFRPVFEDRYDNLERDLDPA